MNVPSGKCSDRVKLKMLRERGQAGGSEEAEAAECVAAMWEVGCPCRGNSPCGGPEVGVCGEMREPVIRG